MTNNLHKEMAFVAAKFAQQNPQKRRQLMNQELLLPMHITAENQKFQNPRPQSGVYNPWKPLIAQPEASSSKQIVVESNNFEQRKKQQVSQVYPSQKKRVDLYTAFKTPKQDFEEKSVKKQKLAKSFVQTSLEISQREKKNIGQSQSSVNTLAKSSSALNILKMDDLMEFM